MNILLKYEALQVSSRLEKCELRDRAVQVGDMDGPTAAALRRSLTAFLFPDGSPSEEIHGSISDSGSFQNLLASNPQSSVVFALHPSYLCIRAFLCTDGAEWSGAPAKDDSLENCIFSCDIELVRFLDHVYVSDSHASAGLVTLRSSISMNPPSLTAPQNGILYLFFVYYPHTTMAMRGVYAPIL